MELLLLELLYKTDYGKDFDREVRRPAAPPIRQSPLGPRGVWRACVCTCVCTGACVYACLCVCTCVHADVRVSGAPPPPAPTPHPS